MPGFAFSYVYTVDYTVQGCDGCTDTTAQHSLGVAVVVGGVYRLGAF